ncbi:hypothetical protein DAEQUDRAFT_755452 [Daedalea quercina L-15889]|uniref:Uncharacterized protein n=1 Tax=Daedalea quercina L-15889 TaxID=1314783 RepID=A0A165SFZ3_9APHY|nr:hypothetical protein DAEQUDRAFT_755452 [Daedalea quercina L-15889]
MRHRDFEFFIECNDRVLEEYATEIDGTVINCYVISEAGKLRPPGSQCIAYSSNPGQVFDIRCTNHSSAGVAISGAVDGRKFPRRTFFQADGVAGGIVCRDDVNGHRQFLFSDVEVTGDPNHLCNPVGLLVTKISGDEDAEHIMSDISNVGLMQLNVFRCRVDGVKPYQPPTGLITTNLELLPEKAKKEGTHCVSYVVNDSRIHVSLTAAWRFGQVNDPTPKWMHFGTYIDAASSPYITFNIRHLSSGEPSCTVRVAQILMAVVAILQARSIVAPLGAGSPSTQTTCDVSNKREDPTVADSHGWDASPEREGRGDRAATDSERPLKRPCRAATVPVAGAPSSGRSATTEALQVVNTKPLSRAQLRVLQHKLNHIENGRKQAGCSLSLKREPSPLLSGGPTASSST